MSTPQSKEGLIRLAWTTALRLQGDRQCHDTYRDGRGHVCALGLLFEVAGSDLHTASPREVGELAGLNAECCRIVVALNDGCSISGSPKRTFGEIADQVDSWFAPAKVEFARDHDLPQPGDWPKNWHWLYETGREGSIVKRAERHRDNARARLAAERRIEARQRFLSKFIGEVED